MSQLIYSSSPHIKSGVTTRKIMLEVCLALLPATIASVVFFGLPALWIMLVSIAAAKLSEVVYRLCQGVKMNRIIKEFDATSSVTGMLIGLNMPAGVPLYVPALASIFAIVITKMLFGGTGRNVVNPAIAGRVFAFMAFGAMTVYSAPIIGSIADGTITTGATNLNILLNGTVEDLANFNLLDMLIGTNVAGVIGETCRAGLLLGGVYLCIRKIINFRWPLVYIATTGLVTVAIYGFNFAYFLPSILSGGLILGAVFMATDYVTSPTTKLGNYIYFVVLGALTAVLRYLTGIEVVSFAILFMNLLVPMFDKYILPRPFGFQKPKAVKEDK